MRIRGLFRSHLAWGHIVNRPFMRAYHNLAIPRMEQQAWQAAIEILSRQFGVNPNDNQGVRYELPGCWFETGDIAAVIEHCRRHDDDGSPFMLYPNALAHALADDTPAARSALKRAILAQPRVGKALEALSTLWGETIVPCGGAAVLVQAARPISTSRGIRSPLCRRRIISNDNPRRPLSTSETR